MEAAKSRPQGRLFSLRSACVDEGRTGPPFLLTGGSADLALHHCWTYPALRQPLATAMTSTLPLIANLAVDATTEAELQRRFARWADHFKLRMQRGGFNYLLEEYAKVIARVESRSCRHGPRGTVLKDRQWQHCCGVSYEYRNDISVRTAIEIIIRVAAPALGRPERERLATLDTRLHALYAHQPPRRGSWWECGLPLGVLP